MKRRQSLKYRPASTSRSTPPAWPTRVRWPKATRARCLSAAASSTRSMPSPTRTASDRSRFLRQAFIGPTASRSRTARSDIAELSKVSKIDKVEDSLDNPPKPTMIYDNLPKDEAHGWKFIAIGPDNKLYVEVGQPGNNVLHDDAHGQIRRMNLDGTGAEVYALGVRRSVGFDWNPVNKQLYFTDNGRDWLSEDIPNDELNRVTKVGQDFGAPYCLQGNIT